jgi:hypothetical protein
MTCPFCKQDMYHYVDVGVGFVPVAVNCCEAGIAWHNGEKTARQIIRFRQSHSPRKKARAKRLMDKHYWEFVT